MRLKSAQKVHYDSGPNMTPLVDIVMVILIFLMLTGTFALGEHFLQSNVPITSKGVGGVTPPPGKLPDEPLEIRVDGFTAKDQSGQTVDMWQAQAGGYTVRNDRKVLAEQLNKMRIAWNRNNTPTEKIQVQINPSRITKYKHLVEVYEAALDARFTKISFTTAH